MSELGKIRGLLADKASYLLEHECKTISRERLHLPSANFVDQVFLQDMQLDCAGRVEEAKEHGLTAANLAHRVSL